MLAVGVGRGVSIGAERPSRWGKRGGLVGRVQKGVQVGGVALWIM